MIDEETKIRATKEDADVYFATDSMEGACNLLDSLNTFEIVDAKLSNNFISDLFFLLNAFQHLGLVKTISTRGRAEKNISEMEKELNRTEASRGDWTGVSLSRRSDPQPNARPECGPRGAG